MYCTKCGAELKFEEAEICPSCGTRLKAIPQPPSDDPCGCGTVLASISILIGVVLSLAIFYPAQDRGTTWTIIIVGLIFIGGGLAFFAKKSG